MIEPAIHGGDIRRVARAAGRDVDDFIDFSANINPAGPPAGVRRALAAYAAEPWITRYPEPGLPELAAALARARGVDPEQIVIHAGSAALFDVLLRAVAPRRLGLCLPAFAEYARAATANGLATKTLTLDPTATPGGEIERVRRWARADEIDALVLTNPHNPLGFSVPATALRGLRAALPGTTFIIDEAFADYDESLSLARDAATDEGLIVVRSVTKFFAMPDLRIGYAVMSAARARSVAPFIPAWPVCGIAATAAIAAIADGAYADGSRVANARERAALARALAELGLRVLPATANFVTFEVPGASAIARRLMTHDRIVVRDCSSFAGLPPDRFIRVAVRDATDNARLVSALAMALGNRSGQCRKNGKR